MNIQAISSLSILENNLLQTHIPKLKNNFKIHQPTCIWPPDSKDLYLDSCNHPWVWALSRGCPNNHLSQNVWNLAQTWESLNYDSGWTSEALLTSIFLKQGLFWTLLLCFIQKYFFWNITYRDILLFHTIVVYLRWNK